MDYLRLIFINKLDISPITEIKLSFLQNSIKQHNIEYIDSIFTHSGKVEMSTFYPCKKIKIVDVDSEGYIKKINGKYRPYNDDGYTLTVINNGEITCHVISYLDKYKRLYYKRIYYDKYPKIKNIMYIHNMLIHKEDGPAIIYYEDDKIVSESYYQNGKLHRINGPSVITAEYSEYWENGNFKGRIYNNL